MRHDNADLRLMEKGEALGLVAPSAVERMDEKRRRIGETLTLLRKRKVGPHPLLQHLRRPGARFSDLYELAPDLAELSIPGEVQEQVLIEARYEKYIERQLDQIARLRRLEKWQFPAEFRYEAVPGLRREAREKLSRFRPRTLGHARRIDGVTPVDLSILMVALKAQLPKVKVAPPSSTLIS